MTANEFNQLSLDEKFSFIRKSLGKRACGFCNELTFEDMSISFLFGAYNGKPAYAIAEALPVELREPTRNILKRIKQNCIITIMDHDPEYAKSVLEAKIDNSKN
ncbi:MAG: hypothetical protein ABIN04_03025 [Ginsengibacter sp.]